MSRGIRLRSRRDRYRSLVRSTSRGIRRHSSRDRYRRLVRSTSRGIRRPSSRDRYRSLVRSTSRSIRRHSSRDQLQSLGIHQGQKSENIIEILPALTEPLLFIDRPVSAGVMAHSPAGTSRGAAHASSTSGRRGDTANSLQQSDMATPHTDNGYLLPCPSSNG